MRARFHFLPLAANRAMKIMGRDLAKPRSKRPIFSVEMAQGLLINRRGFCRWEHGNSAMMVGSFASASLLVPVQAGPSDAVGGKASLLLSRQ